MSSSIFLSKSTIIIKQKSSKVKNKIKGLSFCLSLSVVFISDLIDGLIIRKSLKRLDIQLLRGLFLQPIRMKETIEAINPVQIN